MAKRTTSPLLRLSGVSTDLITPRGVVHALDRVGFEVHRGEAVAIVGESGCGKSMTARSILRVLPRRADRITGGEVRFDGTDLTGLGEREMRRLRGSRVAMIFQDPMSHLDPLIRIGDQIAEVIAEHRPARGTALRDEVRAALKAAQVPDVDRVAGAFPHQLSGGLRQRTLIAMALACQPDLLIADEPTTALDVTTQRQILDLLGELVDTRGMGLVLITHDLGVVASLCDRVYVMYAGQIVEHASVDAFFAGPRHPYARGLLAASTSLGDGIRPLASIPGTVPNLMAPPGGCRFRGRCLQAVARCASDDPAGTLDHAAARDAACWLAERQEASHA